MAEEAGFEALWISDHFHPWFDEQGQSSFVWSVIGAISQVTSLPIGTAVTCPLRRIHPAIVAQAAASSALLTGGKFTLGVGTGEGAQRAHNGARLAQCGRTARHARGGGPPHPGTVYREARGRRRAPLPG